VFDYATPQGTHDSHADGGKKANRRGETVQNEIKQTALSKPDSTKTTSQSSRTVRAPEPLNAIKTDQEGPTQKGNWE